MLVVLGIMLIVVGAVVRFGIDAAVEGLDLAAIGAIFIAGGVLALLAAAVRGAGWMSMTNQNHHTRSERHVSPDGNHVVEETEVH